MARVKTLDLDLGKFRNPEAVMAAVEELQNEGIKVYDVYTPFPVHGLDHLMGIERSRLTIAAFLFGCLGLFSAFLMQFYMLYIDWPQDIAGKPYLGLSYIPVCFELTVLFTAFGMVGTFLVTSNLLPGRKAIIMDERVTDDVFVIAIDKDMHDESTMQQAAAIFDKHNAFEISNKLIIDEYFQF